MQAQTKQLFTLIYSSSWVEIQLNSHLTNSSSWEIIIIMIISSWIDAYFFAAFITPPPLDTDQASLPLNRVKPPSAPTLLLLLLNQRIAISMIRRGQKRALEYFLMSKPPLKPDISPIKYENHELVDSLVKSAIYPLVDKHWIPDPLVYRQLGIPQTKLEELRKFDEENNLNFQTRILLLQAFLDESKFISMHGSISENAKQCTNSRLHLIGSQIYNSSVVNLLVHLHPGISASNSHRIMCMVSEKYLLNKLATGIYDFNKLLIAAPMHDITSFSSHQQHSLKNRDNESQISKALLSLMGALYLDQGMMKSLEFVYGTVMQKGGLFGYIDSLLLSFKSSAS